MENEEQKELLFEAHLVESVYLKRTVTVDFYLPAGMEDPLQLGLLLINDGQNLREMNFAGILEGMQATATLQPVLCVGIHAGEDRKNEYGTAGVLDYMGRGTKAMAYQQFLLEELFPFIHSTYHVTHFSKMGIAGFSLGGLSALDTAWHHPEMFSVAGVFSGSLWWRTKSFDDGYNEDTDRIMHQLIQGRTYYPGQRFYFTTGSLDETEDRNNNGIIDSIDDTIALVDELKNVGYTDADICYINIEDGRHDVETWARALPHFLVWGFEKVVHPIVPMTAESC